MFDSVHPFHDLSANEQATIVSLFPTFLPFLTPLKHSPVDFSNIKFKAIIVCHDPRNWGMDIQIMCDILLGNGYITAGTPQAREKKPTAVDVIFCNPDLLWKNEFEVSRFGQGGFRFAWEAVWRVSFLVSVYVQMLTVRSKCEVVKRTLQSFSMANHMCRLIRSPEMSWKGL